MVLENWQVEGIKGIGKVTLYTTIGKRGWGELLDLKMRLKTVYLNYPINYNFINFWGFVCRTLLHHSTTYLDNFTVTTAKPNRLQYGDFRVMVNRIY